MRVLLISRGDFVHLAPFLEYMQQRDWDVHLAALSPWQYPAAGVTCHRCYCSDSRLLKPVSYLYGAGSVRALLRKISPDLVWGHYVSSAGSVAWLSGVRNFALTVHGSDVLDVMQRRRGRFMLQKVLPCAKHIHAVSQQTAEACVQLGVDKARIQVIPFGIDVDAVPFQPSEVRPPLKLICTRSLQYAIYDIPTILQAVGILVQHGLPISLTLCGRGILQSELEQRAAKLGIVDNVRFLGGYDPGQLVDLLHAHNLYVSASFSDGASLSLMEAMAAGLFPVVSDIPANRNWIHNANGLFFQTQDAEQLAEQLSLLAAGKIDISAAVHANRQFVETHGNRPTNMNRILDMVTS